MGNAACSLAGMCRYIEGGLVMHNTDRPLTREAWLEAFAVRSKPQFDRAGAPLPSNIRVSIGFTSTGRKGKRIGECWGEVASADGHFEIFIVPTMDSDARIADILTHELVHAAVGLAAGHGAAFKRVAVSLGLEGKMTATTAGDAWRVWAEPILRAIGPMPGAALASFDNGKKKQSTRMVKCTCDECGMTFRTAAKWLDSVSICPDAACGGTVTKG